MKIFKLLQGNQHFELESPVGNIPRPSHVRPNDVFEPICQNRFIAHFPEEFGISSNFIQSISHIRGVVNIVNGHLITNELLWDPIIVTFIDTLSVTHIMFEVTQNLDHYSNFHIDIERLDAFGESQDHIMVHVSCISSINFGNVSYASDEINRIEMEFIIRNVLIL